MILEFRIRERSMPSGAGSPTLRFRTRPPRFTILSTVTTPRKGLLFSALLHGVLVASLIWLPILFPIRPATVRAADLLREYDYHPLLQPALPELQNPGRSAEAPHESASATLRAETRPTPERATTSREPDYSGPQEIVADLPDPTNNVEVIRRPDLIVPPDLVYPVRLPSLVMLPPRAIRVRVAAKVDTSALAQLEQIDVAAQSSTENPALPVSTPKLPAAALAPAAPRTRSSDGSVAAYDGLTAPEITESKAAVVINAVSLPAEPLAIPDAQLSGKFVVGPPKDVNGPETIARAAEVAAVPNVVPDVMEDSLRVIADANAPAPIAPSATGAPSSGGHTVVAENRNLPGISISGGTPPRVATAITSAPRKSYAITIMSGGASGGAARDFGVFGRDETVYTVYIPMTGIGDGSACPFEYALMNTPPSRIALPTPPVAMKKVPAIGPENDSGNSERVFVTGIITETGKLEGLRAIRASGGRAQSAVAALEQWEFEPAQLEGKAVASKMLIGIAILPEGKTIGQN